MSTHLRESLARLLGRPAAFGLLGIAVALVMLGGYFVLGRTPGVQRTIALIVGGYVVAWHIAVRTQRQQRQHHRGGDGG